MIAIIYVAKNNQREFVPSPRPPLPHFSPREQKNVIQFFLWSNQAL